MADMFSPEQRSQNMSAVRARDTKPELTVRRLVHSLGYRYRLYRKDLPGSPDLAFISKQKVIFVHGCFWHRHARCSRGNVPQSNAGFWLPKLEKTVRRDAKVIRRLRSSGWKVLVLWECQLVDSDKLRQTITSFLGRVKTARCRTMSQMGGSPNDGG
jgi:DNA mismatch endonuclease (patch repair protein)